MPHLTLQLLLLLLLAFLIGCILGCLIRSMAGTGKSTPAKPAAASAAETKPVAEKAFQAKQSQATGSESKPEPEPVKKAAPAEKAAPAKIAAPASEPVASKPTMKKVAEPVSTGKPSRPKGLPGARGGKADKLQMISGVGPKLEKTLHGLGFFHFDQIAGWGKDQVDWVDEHLRYKGRIERDEWIAQCKLLAADDMDQFNKLYGPGRSAKTAAKPKSAARKASKKSK